MSLEFVLLALIPIRGSGIICEGNEQYGGGWGKLKAVLYKAALVATKRNPVIAAFYQRLLDAGKVRKAALVACMRKLLTMVNAMTRTMTVWNPRVSRGNVITEAS